jgi:hypothetical protein
MINKKRLATLLMLSVPRHNPNPEFTRFPFQSPSSTACSLFPLNHKIDPDNPPMFGLLQRFNFDFQVRLLIDLRDRDVESSLAEVSPALQLMTSYRLVIEEVTGTGVITSYTRWVESVQVKEAEKPGSLPVIQSTLRAHMAGIQEAPCGL